MEKFKNDPGNHVLSKICGKSHIREFRIYIVTHFYSLKIYIFIIK